MIVLRGLLTLLLVVVLAGAAQAQTLKTSYGNEIQAATSKGAIARLMERAAQQATAVSDNAD